MSYINEFEKIQQMKLNNTKDYKETKTHYHVNNTKLQKKFYYLTQEHIKSLKKQISDIKKQISSKRYLYIMSRSDVFQEKLMSLYDELAALKKKISSVKEKKTLFIPQNENEPSESNIQDDSESNIQDDSKEKENKNSNTGNTGNTKPLSAAKRRQLKNFLFKTYEECSSRKTKQPFYMSKKDIIEKIYENDEELIKKLPKNFTKLGKSELCKVIFTL